MGAMGAMGAISGTGVFCIQRKNVEKQRFFVLVAQHLENRSHCSQQSIFDYFGV
jgi:hypothetical protein